jgi:hypothetical protein
MTMSRSYFLAIVLALLCPVASLPAEPAAEKPLLFESDIAPVLRIYCWHCHGGGELAAGLDLRSQPLILAGGTHGPAVIPGDPEKSLLYQKVVQGEMPPEKSIQEHVVFSPIKPTPEHQQLLRRWIEEGAPALYTGRPLNASEDPPLSEEERQWWAFQTPVRPALPVIDAPERARTAIDQFLLARLEKEKISFSGDADRATLLQRVFMDLAGLPPSLEQIRDFEQDMDPMAFDRRVDQLLASTAFGQRWARRWLDAVGYTDVMGVDNDASIIKYQEGKWRYRDYVVDALNSNMPYDQFLREQLAGDELVDWRGAKEFTPEIRRHLVATGFLRQAADSTGEKELNTADIRTHILLDTVQMVSSNLLGMTVHCAQCHTHKFDPISHADYYRMVAIFAPAINPQKWKHVTIRHLNTVSESERASIDAHNNEQKQQVDKALAEINSIRASFRSGLLEKKRAMLPQQIREDVQKAIETPADKRNEIQKYLAEKLEPLVRVEGAEVDEALDEAARRQIAELGKIQQQAEAAKKQYQPITALWEFSSPPTQHLFLRGDFEKPGPAVSPGVIRVMDRGEKSFVIPTAGKDSLTSGYRRAFAGWLTRPDHPLTARVYVNRVWQRYFGRGIVPTTDNFGTSGMLPSHPELLDWLARDFVDNGWNVKRLHRMIVSSTVYRQASDTGSEVSEAERIDPQNILLWRMPLRRLESEIIRDRVLHASGMLEDRLGGPPVPVLPRADSSVVIDTSKLTQISNQYRRSIYVLARRNYHLSQLDVFDQPVLPLNCTKRNTSAVVQQSLSMLNSEFILDQAEILADRVSREAASGSQADRIGKVFQLAFSRQPAAEEQEWCGDFLGNQAERLTAAGEQAVAAEQGALVNLCQMLLNTNEFLYVR